MRTLVTLNITLAKVCDFGVWIMDTYSLKAAIDSIKSINELTGFAVEVFPINPNNSEASIHHTAA